MDAKRTRPSAQRRENRRRLFLEVLEDRTIPSTFTGQAYGQLPLSFEANQGQTDPQVNFLSRGSGYDLFLTPAEAVLTLSKPLPKDGAALTVAQLPAADVLRMRLVGGNAAAHAATFLGARRAVAYRPPLALPSLCRAV